MANLVVTPFPNKELCGELISLMYAFKGKDMVQKLKKFETVIIAILDNKEVFKGSNQRQIKFTTLGYDFHSRLSQITMSYTVV